MVTRERAYMFAHNPNYDPVDVTHLAARPTTGTFGLRVASWFKSDRRKVLVRWAVAYVTSPPALFVLSLGIAGLIGALAQFVVLKQVEAAAPELAKQVGNFAGDVVDMLNGASLRSAQTTNQVLEGVTEELNENLFGWLTEGTQTLNDTLNAFTNEMENGVENFLGDTPLAGPAKEIIRCIIGLKIESLQKGLTWLHDNAKISFPGIPEDTFSLGAIDSLDSSGTGSDSFLSDPEGASSDMITDTLLKTTERWESMITEEAAISGAVVGVWVIVALIALIRIACLFWGKEKTRGEGGGQGTVFTGNGRAAVVPAASKAMSPSPPYHEEFPQQIKEHSGPSISNNPYHPKESVDSHRHQQPYANDDDLEWGNDVKRASWENDNDFGHQPKRV